MTKSVGRFGYWELGLLLLLGLTSAAMAFQVVLLDVRSVTYDRQDFQRAAIASLVALAPYTVMTSSTLLTWHPRMNGRGVGVLFVGNTMLSVLGVSAFAMLMTNGPTDPDTTQHMAVFVWPILTVGCAIAVTVFAIIVGAVD